MKQCRARQDVYADVIPCGYVMRTGTVLSSGKPSMVMRCQRESGHEGDHAVAWREDSELMQGMYYAMEFSWPRR